MIVKEKKIKTKIFRGRQYYITVLVMKCDNCGVKFEDNEGIGRRRKSQFQFCSKKCTGESKKRFEIMQQTNLKKYGNKFYLSSDIGKAELEQYYMDGYGVTNALLVPHILDKITATCLEKYGNETYGGSDEWKSKLDFKDIAKKRWETMSKIGNYPSSKPEARMYQILVNKFGDNKITRQFPLLNQKIDFKIQINKKKFILIQVDGIYWHGLDRKVSEIKNSTVRQDIKIYRQMRRDKELNKYCKANDILLFRITDKQLKKLTDKEVIKMIKEII